jgi:hypothetical protein
VNLPISDTLAARFAFNAESRDSFYKFTGPNTTPRMIRSISPPILRSRGWTGLVAQY